MTEYPEGISRTLTPATYGQREPHRVAIVQDWGIGLQPLYDQYDATQLAFEEAYESGLLDRPVELKVIEVEGLPYARASTLLEALDRVVSEFAPIAVIGPHTSENVPVVTPYIESTGIPFIAQSGALDVAGPWTFLTPNGTFSDEAIRMVDYAVDVSGAHKIGLISEDNLLGEEYARWIKKRAGQRGASIVADVRVGSFVDEATATAAVQAMRDAGAEAYMYVGFGATAFAVLGASQRAAADGYGAARITMSIFMGTIDGLSPYVGLIDNFEGWVGVDQFDERNRVFTDMLDRFEKRFGRRPMHCYTAQGYDMGNVVAHGLASAKPLTRDGLRRSLESVRRLDAAAGGPGNHISFARYDHRGYKGDYIVMRQIVNGANVLAIDGA
ncbi:ABC transporter substrate-binding protein [Mycobacterium sp. NBC_00419]|uniref:ABC transporter substrate-binding protein n=1 Tax=Mycobacterium sp. NBC_00419 TaxID=2975989 RepID=UPI002E2153F5